jgi:hypothetical protein
MSCALDAAAAAEAALEAEAIADETVGAFLRCTTGFFV